MRILGQSVTLPENITKIEDHTFNRCEALESIIIPDGVTSITILENVNFIDNATFTGCRLLTTINCKPLTPPTIRSSVFNALGQIINVSEASVAAYKEAWLDYADYIVEVNDNDRQVSPPVVEFSGGIGGSRGIGSDGVRRLSRKLVCV